MAAIFHLPREGGTIASGYTLNFYNAGTTTPQTVYSDDGLTVPIAQPIEADSEGQFPKIFLATGTYKTVLKDEAGNTVYIEDDCDSGIPAGAGALSVPDGGTGASTAAGARTNLGAAAQTEVDTLSSSVSSIEAQITGVGGALGDLAGRDDITRDQLGTGFGVVLVQNSVISGFQGTVLGCSGTIPYDDSEPQNSEGTQVLSGSFTPKSASSLLEFEIIIPGSMSTAQNACLALFQNTTPSAIAAVWQRFDSTNMQTLRLFHRMSSPGTSAVTFTVRCGAAAGTFYVNGNSSGTRIGGSILWARMIVKELLTF